MIEAHEEVLAIPTSLAGEVASISFWRKTRSEPQAIVRLPDAAASIVIHCDAHGSPRLSVVGPIQRAYYKPSVALRGYCRVTFRVGYGRSALGAPLCELVDGTVDLATLWGASAERIFDAISPSSDPTSLEAVEGLLSVLGSRFREGHSITSRVADRASRALAHADAPSVRSVAASMGVSERFLRNAFRDEIGVSPKRYARIIRIRRAAAAMTGRASLADLASTLGFFDQAHLNAEFQTLLGTTPTAFRAGQFPTSPNCGRIRVVE